MEQSAPPTEKFFHIKILGRMLEHLGVQMYKKRNSAIAELVANAWDAGAEEVYIQIPDADGYSPETSQITVEDNGSGMNTDSIEHKYMVLGRNRRKTEGIEIELEEEANDRTKKDGEEIQERNTRKVMGRKGIGKLAGFGIASAMTVQTWQNGATTEFTMNKTSLKVDDNVVSDIPIPYQTYDHVPENLETAGESGTRIILTNLKHASPMEIDSLNESLSRRFSRIVRGQMTIYINSNEISEPDMDYKYRFPEDGSEFAEAELSDGNIVKYEWRLADKPIKQTEMRGFTIHANGKTAQAPNFFFNVESVAAGQHGTKYLVGTIEADYLDQGTDDESDYISTDRQEIDWEIDEMKPLYEWGQKLTKDALLKNNELAADKFETDVLAFDDIKERIERLGKSTESQIKKMLRIVGKSEPDPERTRDLADALVRAYEYEHFHNSIGKIESIEDPEMLRKLLEHLHEWKTMESVAILTIIEGRLAVIEKFHQMTVNDAPETANRNKYGDNMHDLLAGYPWLLNPEWQVLEEEKYISTQLKEWHYEDIKDEDARMRYDFLALGDDKRLVVIEIKRSGHALETEDILQVEKYRGRLELAHEKPIVAVVIYSGNINMSADSLKDWMAKPNLLLQTWKGIYEKTRTYYIHYKAVLEGDINHPDFFRKDREVKETRSMLEAGRIYRSPEKRREGVPASDVDYKEPEEYREPEDG